MRRFTGFRKLCESEQGTNTQRILARDLNIIQGNNDQAMDMISPGNAIEFKGHQLKSLNKIIGIDGHDVAMKMIQVVKRNKNGVLIKDVTGGCDKDGLNTGREYGPYAGRPFPHAPCSPTSEKSWWIGAKDWDRIWMPLPPGGSQGGMGGGMGLGGGMGGGAPPSPPPGGGASSPPPLPT